MWTNHEPERSQVKSPGRHTVASSIRRFFYVLASQFRPNMSFAIDDHGSCESHAEFNVGLVSSSICLFFWICFADTIILKGESFKAMHQGSSPLCSSCPARGALLWLPTVRRRCTRISARSRSIQPRRLESSLEDCARSGLHYYEHRRFFAIRTFGRLLVPCRTCAL